MSDVKLGCLEATHSEAAAIDSATQPELVLRQRSR